mmetsp:Transcript_3160/g.10045  ORF Transcript_3160/g.10045 Transcript_3160/m.10045 type:complete len:415 (+) Transcript_3160:90-1334(+)
MAALVGGGAGRLLGAGAAPPRALRRRDARRRRTGGAPPLPAAGERRSRSRGPRRASRLGEYPRLGLQPRLCPRRGRARRREQRRREQRCLSSRPRGGRAAPLYVGGRPLGRDASQAEAAARPRLDTAQRASLRVGSPPRAGARRVAASAAHLCRTRTARAAARPSGCLRRRFGGECAAGGRCGVCAGGRVRGGSGCEAAAAGERRVPRGDSVRRSGSVRLREGPGVGEPCGRGEVRRPRQRHWQGGADRGGPTPLQLRDRRGAARAASRSRATGARCAAARSAARRRGAAAVRRRVQAPVGGGWRRRLLHSDLPHRRGDRGARAGVRAFAPRRTPDCDDARAEVPLPEAPPSGEAAVRQGLPALPRVRTGVSLLPCGSVLSLVRETRVKAATMAHGRVSHDVSGALSRKKFLAG